MESQELSLKMLRVYIQRVLNFNVGLRGVVANGRILGPFRDDEVFSVEDYALLEQFSTALYGEKLKKTLEKTKEDEDAMNTNSYMKIVSLLVSRPQSKSRFEVNADKDDEAVIRIPAVDPERAAFDIVVIVDPVSRGAQKIGPIIQVLQEVLNCDIRVYLNSAEKNSDMPLKRFYRFDLEPEIQFLDDGKQLPGPNARFNDMPQSPLVTQNMHVADNWLVEVVRSIYDLDNIRLENVDSNVHR